MKRIILFVSLLLLIAGCAVPVKKQTPRDKGMQPLLSLVFDDGNDTDFSIARDVLMKEGAKASFAVITDRINTKGYLTVPQLLQLQAEGFEIMSHTRSHPNLRDLDDIQIDAELSGSKKALEDIGINVSNLVYPYNKNNARVREIAGNYYRSARGGRSMLNSVPPERYELKSYSMRHDMRRIEGLIDEASSEGRWLILYLHNLDMNARVVWTNGSFQPGELLVFNPSHATGKFSMRLFTWFYFVPLSGTPLMGDTVMGRSSGASCRLNEIVYDDAAYLKEVIDYVRSRHPEMRIITINEGLDIYGMR